MVCPDVHQQVGFLVGTVAAVRAGEGSFSSMDPHVTGQKGREVEPLPTDTALVATVVGGGLARGRRRRGGQVQRGLWEATPGEGRKCAASWLLRTTHMPCLPHVPFPFLNYFLQGNWHVVRTLGEEVCCILVTKNDTHVLLPS